MDNINVEDLLGNILKRANGMVDCVPGCLQDNIREVIDCIKKFSIEQGFKYEINDDNFIYHGKLSGENLYMSINTLSNDLGICNLLFPMNVYLEDVAYNIGVIISFMSKYNYQFSLCCNNGKRRIK